MRTVLTKEDIAYEEGFKAYNDGIPFTSNPKPYGSRERTSWFAGWEHGEKCGGNCNAN